MINIRFPSRLSIDSADEVLKLCKGILETKEDKLCVDLSEVKWTEPVGVTLLAGTIRIAHNKRKEMFISGPEDKKVKKYLSRIGLLKYFGVNGLRLQPRYTSIELRQLTAIDPIYFEGIVELLDSEMRLSGGVKDSIDMSLKELVTNVFDHSKSDVGCLVCAQFIPKRQIIWISAADWGIGILQSLRTRDEYKNLKSDTEAITQAVEEGISSRPGRAGLGLNHIKRFLRVNKGTLTIISGRGRVDFLPTATRTQTINVSHQGTIANMRIHANKEAFYYMKNGEGKIF